MRTLPRAIQLAYRVVMGCLLLTPEEGARSTVWCAAAKEAAALAGPAPYVESGCAAAQCSPEAAAAGEASWDYALRELGLREADVL